VVETINYYRNTQRRRTKRMPTQVPSQTDRDKIQRLFAELQSVVHTFQDEEDASPVVMVTACGEFVAHTLAGFSATAEDTTEHAAKRLGLALDAFERSFWREFQRLKR
jgi:hypothetical protein